MEPNKEELDYLYEEIFCNDENNEAFDNDAFDNFDY